MNRSLRELLFEAYGDGAGSVLRGFCVRPVTLRVNTLRSDKESVAGELSSKGIAYREAPCVEGAFVLGGDVTERDIRGTEAYERGGIYLQSLSSMLPPLYLGAQAGEDILDMTAAPGGKAAQICALTGGKALLTACERDAVRFQRMKFNFERQGARVNAIRADALMLDEAFSFDRILLDAPCSGSGTVRDEHTARIDEAFVLRCSERQKKLIGKAYRLLKRGGTLVYSTCSVLPQENGDAFFDALKGLSFRPRPLTPPPGAELLPSPEGTVCICPDALFEGFFIASIVKE